MFNCFIFGGFCCGNKSNIKNKLNLNKLKTYPHLLIINAQLTLLMLKHPKHNINDKKLLANANAYHLSKKISK